ncbi:MAG: hypothetical protein FRX49_09453 [Trebouxia sp. A1-2]|nr:MAG: hypothetical protein FRX49_09453 [Trebouxia sp. A1-2]
MTVWYVLPEQSSTTFYLRVRWIIARRPQLARDGLLAAQIQAINLSVKATAKSAYATLPNKSSKPRTSKKGANPEDSIDLSSVSGPAGKKVGTSRSPTSYQYFKKAQYEQLKSSSTQPIRVASVEKELSAKWKALSDEQRQPYVDMVQVKTKKVTKKLNGYQFWMKTNVPSVTARNPKISPKQVFTSMGHEWKAMTDADKQTWKEKAEKEFASSEHA